MTAMPEPSVSAPAPARTAAGEGQPLLVAEHLVKHFPIVGGVLRRRVGAVRDVLPGPANDVLELDSGLLLPLVEDCVREVDVSGRRILLNPGFIA